MKILVSLNSTLVHTREYHYIFRFFKHASNYFNVIVLGKEIKVQLNKLRNRSEKSRSTGVKGEKKNKVNTTVPKRVSGCQFSTDQTGPSTSSGR